jgi:hypothetical protein
MDSGNVFSPAQSSEILFIEILVAEIGLTV